MANQDIAVGQRTGHVLIMTIFIQIRIPKLYSTYIFTICSVTRVNNAKYETFFSGMSVYLLTI
jgi:hypothetical protein